MGQAGAGKLSFGRATLFMAGLLAAVAMPAAQRRHLRGRHSYGMTLRKRLHVNDVIADPGTIELDWGGLYSTTTSTFTAPATFKWTPGGNSFWRGRTEYSAAFDSVSSAVSGDGRATQFSDRMTLAATSIFFDSEHFDIAVAPQVTAFLRNESGARLGATAIARYDGKSSSFGMTLGWSGATSSSVTNPAGVWDVGAGYGRKLGGRWKRWTPHVDALLERATGFEKTAALFAGVEYQVTERWAVDAVWQRYGLWGGEADRQLLVSFTWNLGGKP